MNIIKTWIVSLTNRSFRFINNDCISLNRITGIGNYCIQAHQKIILKNETTELEMNTLMKMIAIEWQRIDPTGDPPGQGRTLGRFQVKTGNSLAVAYSDTFKGGLKLIPDWLWTRSCLFQAKGNRTVKGSFGLCEIVQGRFSVDPWSVLKRPVSNQELYFLGGGSTLGSRDEEMAIMLICHEKKTSPSLKSGCRFYLFLSVSFYPLWRMFFSLSSVSFAHFSSPTFGCDARGGGPSRTRRFSRPQHETPRS